MYVYGYTYGYVEKKYLVPTQWDPCGPVPGRSEISEDVKMTGGTFYYKRLPQIFSCFILKILHD